MSAPDSRQFRDFLAIDGWVHTRDTDHEHNEKQLPDGELLLTHVSFGNQSYGRGLWSWILRNQLKITNAELWTATSSGNAVERPAAVDEVAPAPVPLWAVRVLRQRRGMTEREIAALPAEEGIALAKEAWAQPPP